MHANKEGGGIFIYISQINIKACSSTSHWKLFKVCSIWIRVICMTLREQWLMLFACLQCMTVGLSMTLRPVMISDVLTGHWYDMLYTIYIISCGSFYLMDCLSIIVYHCVYWKVRSRLKKAEQQSEKPPLLLKIQGEMEDLKFQHRQAIQQVSRMFQTLFMSGVYVHLWGRKQNAS